MKCDSCHERNAMTERLTIRDRAGWFCRSCALDQVAGLIVERPDFLRDLDMRSGRAWAGMEPRVAAAALIAELEQMSAKMRNKRPR